VAAGAATGSPRSTSESPESPVGAPSRATPSTTSSSVAAPLWAEASDLLDGLDDAADVAPVELNVTLSPTELSRLRARAEAQGISLEEALRRLI
jgi:ribonuclease HI